MPGNSSEPKGISEVSLLEAHSEVTVYTQANLLGVPTAAHSSSCPSFGQEDSQAFPGAVQVTDPAGQ